MVVFARISARGLLGISSGNAEDVNSFSQEPSEVEIIEPEAQTKKDCAQLLTLRYAVRIYSDAFALLHRGENEAERRGAAVAKTAAELPAEGAADEIAETQTSEQASEPVTEGKKGHPETSPGQKGLPAGQRVRIVMPGGSLDRIETRVLAQTVDVLGQPVYQLEYQRQGRGITLPAECLQAIASDDDAASG